MTPYRGDSRAFKLGLEVTYLPSSFDIAALGRLEEAANLLPSSLLQATHPPRLRSAPPFLSMAPPHTLYSLPSLLTTGLQCQVLANDCLSSMAPQHSCPPIVLRPLAMCLQPPTLNGTLCSITFEFMLKILPPM